MEVKTIAVIGADTVGRGIASIAALSGYDTVLEDVSDERLAKAAAWIERNHESFVAGSTPEARGRDRRLPHVCRWRIRWRTRSETRI